MEWRHAGCALHEALAGSAAVHELLEEACAPAALRAFEALGRLLQRANPFCERPLRCDGDFERSAIPAARSDPVVQLSHLLL